MTNYNKIRKCYVKCKCENAWHVQSNVTLEITAEFAISLTANICLLLAILI